MLTKYRKIDAARQQIDDAMCAYFSCRYHTAIVLAGAADDVVRGMIEDLPPPADGRKHALAFRDRRAAAVLLGGDAKAIGAAMNLAYTESKHPGLDHAVIEMDARFEAHDMIDRARTNYDYFRTCEACEPLDDDLAQRFFNERL